MRNVTYLSHSDELCHKAGFKYIKKYYKDGKPVYIYADENRHTQLGVMQKASDDAYQKKEIARRKNIIAREKYNSGEYSSWKLSDVHDNYRVARDNSDRTTKAYESELAKNTLGAEARRIGESAKIKTTSLLNKIKSGTISSIKKSKELLAEGVDRVGVMLDWAEEDLSDASKKVEKRFKTFWKR